MLYGIRFGAEFNDPFMPSFAPMLHEYRAGGIVLYGGPGGLTSLFYSHIGIVDDYFLSKGIHEVFSTPGDLYAVREKGRKSDCISYNISPKSAICRNNKRIIFTYFDINHG